MPKTKTFERLSFNKKIASEGEPDSSKFAAYKNKKNISHTSQKLTHLKLSFLTKKSRIELNYSICAASV